jgi:hypothetical protein
MPTTPWIKWLRGTATTIAIFAAELALLWAVSWLWGLLWPAEWDTRTALAVAIVSLALLAALWWLLWRLPRHQVVRVSIQIPDPKARADTEDNFRKTIAQVLGGTAVLIGAGAAYLQFIQQQQVAHTQLQAAHDLLISNQVAKGFEQLASDKVALRLGGIYALEGVMNGSEQYHQPVLETLCAFVRDATIGMIVGEKPNTDIQAALAVIGRRKEGPGAVDLNRANIPGANLRGASLSEANLSGANLKDADLRDTNLGYANLTEANLSEANLGDANLSGRTNLVDANLSRAFLSSTDLRGAFLGGAKLRDAYLWAANLSGAMLINADLAGAFLDGQTQLDQACGKPRTLPEGLHLDKPCPPLNLRTTP